jgi:Ig-like domain from next to BRCA1 gene
MADGTTGNTELDQFLADLRKLREQAGQPSLRVMSRTAHYSHTALSGVVSGARLPSLDLTLAFVRACRGDEGQWRARWHQARGRAGGEDAEVPAGEPPGQLAGEPPSQPAGRAADPRPRRRVLMAAAIASLVAAAVAGVTASILSSSAVPVPRTSHASKTASAQPVSCPARPDRADHPLVPCDDSRFVADVTIPDGTTVRAGQRFVKIWEIRNSGLVPWRGRFERRQGVQSGPGLCSSPPAVPVPTTMPGHDVQIRVTFTAPSLPGSCRVDWRMTDTYGRVYFPYLGGLYVTVNVSG